MKADEIVDCAELVPEPGRFGQPGPLVRCNAPAEVTRTELVDGNDGPVLCIETQCALGHLLYMPREDPRPADH